MKRVFVFTIIALTVVAILAVSSMLARSPVADPCPVPTPVICHAPSEDSAMTDCDYRNGGWYPR